MVKRVLLSCLMLFSSISSALLFAVSSANAATYNIAVTQSLKLRGNSPAGDCGAEEEWNTSWGQFMSTNTNVENSYKNTWNYQSNYDNARATQDAFAQRFQNNLATGSGWAVGHQKAGYGGGGQAISIYLFSPDAQLSIHDGYVRVDSGDDLQMHSFAYNPNSGCRWQDLDYESPTNNNIINADADRPLMLIASDNITYPSDYTGPQIPSAFTPKPDFYVPYILNVDDKNITVTPKAVDTGGKCWKWAATLVKKGSSTSENLGDWEVISETDYLTSNEPARLKANAYGDDYAVGMLAYDCAAPAAKISDSYNLKLERLYPLKINGGSYVLDSDNLNCDNGGVCEEPSPYEDCTSYGADLIGGFGCVMRNFGVLLRSLFITLFVPTPGFLKDYFNDFKEFINTKFGFLIWPLTWAVDFVNAFFNGVNGTNNICSWSFGNVFNSDFKLNFCSLEQNFPAAFNTARYMIQAFTVFALLSGLYGHYRRLIRT